MFICVPTTTLSGIKNTAVLDKPYRVSLAFCFGRQKILETVHIAAGR